MGEGERRTRLRSVEVGGGGEQLLDAPAFHCAQAPPCWCACSPSRHHQGGGGADGCNLAFHAWLGSSRSRKAGIQGLPPPQPAAARLACRHHSLLLG